MPKVVVIGATYLDMVLQGAPWPQRGAVTFADQSGVMFGGKGLNQAVAAARVGAEVTFVTSLGGDDDYLSSNAVRFLLSVGIEVLDERLPGRQLPGVAVITDGDNVTQIGGRQLRGPEGILNGARFKAALEQADSVLFTNDYSHDFVVSIAEAARPYPCWERSVFNPAPPFDGQGLASVAELLGINWVVSNAEEAGLLLRDELPEGREEVNAEAATYCSRLHADGLRNVVTTAGEAGAFFVGQCQPDIPIHAPVLANQTLDTAGAGDAFIAALTVELGNADSGSRRDVEGALYFASSAAAYVCERLGSAAQMPTRDQVLAFITRSDPHGLRRPSAGPAVRRS